MAGHFMARHGYHRHGGDTVAYPKVPEATWDASR
jgi:hypothetical protein